MLRCAESQKKMRVPVWLWLAPDRDHVFRAELPSACLQDGLVHGSVRLNFRSYAVIKQDQSGAAVSHPAEPSSSAAEPYWHVFFCMVGLRRCLEGPLLES